MLNKGIKRFSNSLYVCKDKFILDVSKGWKFRGCGINFDYEEYSILDKLKSGVYTIYVLSYIGVIIEDNKAKVVYAFSYDSLLDELVLDSVYDMLGNYSIFEKYIGILDKAIGIRLLRYDDTIVLFNRWYTSIWERNIR